MTDPEGFLTASQDVVVAVGRVAVGGGILEGHAHEMLLALGGRPEKKTCGRVLAEIKRRATQGELPSYAAVDPAALARWCDRAMLAMEARNRVLHATLYHMSDEQAWRLHSEHLGSGTRLNLEDVEGRNHLDGIAAEFRSLVDESHGLHRGLLREVRDRVYVKPRRHDRDAWIVVFYGDDPNVERPTDDELDRWWAAYGPF